jgi:hypothetical protein
LVTVIDYQSQRKQSTSPHPISLTLSFRIRFPSGLFPSGFLSTVLYTFHLLPSPRNDPWYEDGHVYTDSIKPSTESRNTENVRFKAILRTTNMLSRQQTYDATGVPVCSFRERSADNMEEYCFTSRYLN